MVRLQWIKVIIVTSSKSSVFCKILSVWHLHFLHSSTWFDQRKEYLSQSSVSQRALKEHRTIVSKFLCATKKYIMQQTWNGGYCDMSRKFATPAVDERRKECESHNNCFMRVAYIIFSTIKHNKENLNKFCKIITSNKLLLVVFFR